MSIPVVTCLAYGREPNIIISMSGETWASLYLSQATPEELIESGAMEVTGEAAEPAEAARVINLFDRYSPAEDLVIPSAAPGQM